MIHTPSDGDWLCYNDLGPGGHSGVKFHFVPGNYYIRRDLGANNSSMLLDCPTCTGTNGLFFYFADNRVPGAPTGATFSVGSGSTINLQAGHSGTYAPGVLFFFNKGNPTGTLANRRGMSLAAGVNFPYTGLIYGIDASMSVQSSGVVGSSDCAMIVAGQMSFGFNVDLHNGCTGYGGTVIAQTSAISE